MKAAVVLGDFITYVGELMIVLLFLWTMFGSDEGLGNNIITYLSYAEPEYLQEFASTILTASSYSPGDVEVDVKATGIPHKIKIYSKDQKKENYFITVEPGKTVKGVVKGKVEFSKPESPMPFLIGECSLENDPLELQLKQQEADQMIKIKKENCKIVVK